MVSLVEDLHNRVRDELFLNVMPFWSQKSFDEKFDGFFSCLDNDGSVYDTKKYMWLNGRQIYMYATICARFSAAEIAKFTASFMHKTGVREIDRKVYFSLNQQGDPVHMERKIFSACFLCLGTGALAMVLNEDGVDATELITRSKILLERIVGWSHDPTLLGREQCIGAPRTSPLNVPMILLNILDEFRRIRYFDNPQLNIQIDVAKEEEWCISEILKHVRKEEKMVFETVMEDGSLCPGFEGRHLNPGHAIEAGWFVLSYAIRVDDLSLRQVAQDMIMWSWNRGWDERYGGLFYFLDSEGKSPPFLEWDMKLWWPHCEAMIAFAMLYAQTREQEHLDNLIKVTEYTLKHFSDASWEATEKNDSTEPSFKEGLGEWFGYLNRRGEITHRFKGGPYKGCFHVPRALMMVHQILAKCI
eukprot:GSChrysophyteH1.ASY1.ANO1.3103.1 assembled CDS